MKTPTVIVIKDTPIEELPITALNLSTRALNAIGALTNIYSYIDRDKILIKELLKYTVRDFQSSINVGKITIKEITDVLRANGLALAGKQFFPHKSRFDSYIKNAAAIVDEIQKEVNAGYILTKEDAKLLIDLIHQVDELKYKYIKMLADTNRVDLACDLFKITRGRVSQIKKKY